jgi:hypothetical protein
MAGEIRIGQSQHRFIREFDDAAGVVEQPLPVIRQLRLAAVAGKDRLPEPLFQPLHLHGHGGLGLVNHFGRPGERARIRNGHKGFQLIDVEKRAHVRLPYQQC